MFAALLVGRSLRAPKAASALAALSTRGAGSGFGSNSEGFTAGSWSLFTHLGSANNDKEREKRPALPKHVATLVQAPGVYGAGTLLAEGTSTSGGPSSTPGSGRGAALNADPSGGGGLALLGVAHATLAATAIVVPAAVANTFFPGSALPQGVATQALVQLLGCGLATGSATCFALKQAADDNDLKSPLAQRLQLGLMGFSLGAIALHVLYSPGITPVSMVSGAAVMGTPFGVPYQTYRKAVGSIGPGEVLKRYIGAVPDHLRVTGAQSALYSLLTPTLALAGFSYLFMPGSTLAAAIGYARDASSFFFWQNIGAGLATIAPVMTYSLKTQADAGRLADPISKILNVGLLTASAGHLAVLFPMLSAGQSGPLLPWLVGAWATGAGAALFGLLSGGSVEEAAKKL